ncbi:helix-turn-helix domain-containing protein [Mesobacillus selenatarsenatis]|uniref:Helix-turn-helix domain-containing protein n=1 Tax=Mesobacillus selenatarsenatis TaxID=388741 RepID=A0A846TKT9_9BACI|nr:helix-turn-helix domain-containing protein [Mesobacillus selenatarsenatis]NKE04665.1 helix-turn-helix domain-containing protein [Mesobacillus selenatarsenatis]
MNIGELLRTARKEKQITLRQLSDLTHISFSQLGKIERDEHKPTKENSLKIAEALQISPTLLFQILGYEQEPFALSHKIDPLVRYKVFIRDNLKCRICGNGPSKVALDVDLIVPERDGGEIKLENLVSLCKHCLIGRTEFISSEGLAEDLLFKKNKLKSTLNNSH